MSCTVPAPEGKAWWVQLQHDRAVTAGCQLYTHRPATCGPNISLQQNPGLSEQDARLRPSTVAAISRPLEHTSSTFSCGCAASNTALHSPCVRHDGTSAKLPARKALGSRQGNGIATFSSAVSRPMPMSRGNDWSPLPSRPGTRDTAHAIRMLRSPTEAGWLNTPAASSAAGLCVRPATKQSRKPPLPQSVQQRPFTTPSLLHRPSSLWQVKLVSCRHNESNKLDCQLLFKFVKQTMMLSLLI